MKNKMIGVGVALATALLLLVAAGLAVSAAGAGQVLAAPSASPNTCATDVFFSEYVEGSSFNKALEIYNATGATVDLTTGNYVIERYNNGSPTATGSVALAGSVADGAVFVIAHPSADPLILAVADQQSSEISYNGNDAVVLKHNGVIIDVIGQVGFDPGLEWGSGNISTQDNTIRRLSSVTIGDTNPSDAFDPTLEWEGYPNNTFDGLGEHSTDCAAGLTPIYAIQYTTDPSGASPLVGQVVTTTGVVYAAYAGAGFAIADAAGPWHGIYVYYPSGALPALGDEVQVTGQVLEYFGLTELGNFATYQVLSSGNDVVAPTEVDTGAVATGSGSAESYEGALVIVGPVTVTNPSLGFGEWQIDDGSGAVRVDDLGDYTYVPVLDDDLYRVAGMLYYSFNDFKIEPRNDGDIQTDPPPPPTPTHTIYEIQFTTDPSGDSPLVGQVVTTTGIVYGVYPAGFAIAEDTGAWHGVYVYYPSGAKPMVGDEVVVIGQVQEYFGLTEIGNFATYVTVSGGHAPYAPANVSTGEIATGAVSAEAYEGVFVSLSSIIVTNADAGFGEWIIDDGTDGLRVDDLAFYSYQPTLNENLFLVRGMLYFSFSDFKVEPRFDGDIISAPNLAINKAAPSHVNPNAHFTYQITVNNNTALDLTGLVISDVVPANVTYISGGVYDGVSVEWMVSDLPSSASEVVTFTVAAPGDVYDIIHNDTYGAVATNWMTPTVGAPVFTVVGDYVPIFVLQGQGDISPFAGQTVETEGVVTGFFEGNYPGGGIFNGFFIQDPIGDGDPTTSDGLYVNVGSGNPNVAIGARVRVNGLVEEFDEYDQTNCINPCMTQIAGVYSVVGSGVVTPTTLTPIGDPVLGEAYYEAHEGMLASLAGDQNVVGPTSFGTIMVIPASTGATRAIRSGPYAGMPLGVRHYQRFGDIGSGDPDNLIVGSVVTNVDGPIMTSYGGPMIVTQAGDAWQTVTAAPLPPAPPTWPAAGPTELTTGSFNTLNFDGSAGATHATKILNSIVDVLSCPTILSLEEISVEQVMTDLIADLATAGCPYAYGFSHPDIRGFGVAVLWRTDRVVDVEWSANYQGCSIWGSPEAAAYDNTCDDVPGQYPLFSRRPVVVTATVALNGDQMPVVVIGNHLKSKLGGLPSDYQRLDQAIFLGALVDHLAAQGSHNVVIVGDLNDFEDSAPLNALYASGIMNNAWYTVEQDNQYSYIYQGVSQILDHVLVSDAMLPGLVAMGPVHFNADYPFLPYSDDASVVWRATDHDAVMATFVKPPEPVLSIDKAVMLTETPAEPGDVVTYTVRVINTGAGDALGVHLVDMLPEGLDGSDLDVMVDVLAGMTHTETIVATVAQDAPLGAMIVNTATYTYLEESDSASAAFEIGVPDLSITKEVSLPDATPQPGETVVYTIVVRNDGTAAAHGVMIDDVLPAELVGVDVHVTVDILAGGSYTVTVSAVIAAGVPGDTPITNTATFTYGSASGSAESIFTTAFYLRYLPIIFRQP